MSCAPCETWTLPAMNAMTETRGFNPGVSRLRESAAATRFVQLFDAASNSPAVALNELRSAGMELGRELRREKLQPEEAVMVLKHVLCCHGGFRSLPSMSDQGDTGLVTSAIARYSRVLGWCLDGYYQGTPAD